MKKSNLIAFWLVFAIALGFVTSPAMAGEVSQGKCIQFDEGAKQIVIESYNTDFSKTTPYGKPTGEQEVFDVSGAVIGIPPEPGDILRLAWVSKDSTKSALRVMNVSKQDLRKK